MFGTLCKQPPAMLLYRTIQTWTRSILLYCMQYSRSLQKKPNGAKQSFDDRWSGNKNNNMYMQ